jgi:hypothetical protein
LESMNRICQILTNQWLFHMEYIATRASMPQMTSINSNIKCITFITTSKFLIRYSILYNNSCSVDHHSRRMVILMNIHFLIQWFCSIHQFLVFIQKVMNIIFLGAHELHMFNVLFAFHKKNWKFGQCVSHA